MGSSIFCAFILALLVKLYSSQVSWTPIFVDENSLVDLWTSKSEGCACPFNETQMDCACCTDGGCQCGLASPRRCAQCGLTQYCTNMCNATIDALQILKMSNKSYGQIKPHSLKGPVTCWYRLRPVIGQRVEIQVYRLLNVGRFNGSNCQSGVLQFIDGQDPTTLTSSEGTQLCGENERYNPPVVLFADKSPATLMLRIDESTTRSQFLAYFSFTSNSSSQGVKFQAKGGRRISNTDCDWLYQDMSCQNCLLATPGYPGVYPAFITCQYHLTTNSIFTEIRIKFISLKLPHNYCSSHHINVYQGENNSSKLLKTICYDKDEELVFTGPHLLLEFKGGPSVPPYDYYGFLASVFFTNKPTTTQVIPVLTSEVAITNKSENRNNTVASACEIKIYANSSANGTGHFKSRGLEWHKSCSIVFIGRDNDIVHISLFNYKLKAPSCQSFIEFYDGAFVGSKPAKRICSPQTKHARDTSGKFHAYETFMSSGNAFTIRLYRHAAESESDAEHVDGAYVFHDERQDGTLAPDTLCSTDHYGASSLSEGQITNPGSHQIYWNIEGRLRCSQRFIPATNQSVTLKITSLSKLTNDPHCQTECGDDGCHCVTNSTTLSSIDHLLFMNDSESIISCLCGDFQENWLPVSIRSWSALKLVYSVAHYSWTTQGFNYKTDYSFNLDGACGHHTIVAHSGSLSSTRIVGGGDLNYYYHQLCSWTLDSNVERELTLEVHTSQNRPCSAWNITFYEYSESSPDHLGPVIHRFCPREKRKQYNLTWKLNVIIIKLTAMTRTLPQYFIRWQSQLERTNTRISGPTSSILSSSSKKLSNKSPLTVLVALLIFSFSFVYR